MHSQSNNVSGIELQNNEQNVVPQHVSGQNLDNASQTIENNTTHDSDVRKDELKVPFDFRDLSIKLSPLMFYFESMLI